MCALCIHQLNLNLDSLYIRVIVMVSLLMGKVEIGFDFVFDAEPKVHPTHLRVKSIGRTSAVLRWKTPPKCLETLDILGYSISVEQLDLGLRSMSTLNVNGEKTDTLKLSGLIPGTAYQVRIAAANSAGAGPYSPHVTFETKKG